MGRIEGKHMINVNKLGHTVHRSEVIEGYEKSDIGPIGGIEGKHMINENKQGQLSLEAKQ